MSDTTIEWTDKVWNPTTGCDQVSPGCDHCYALTLAKRLKGMGSPKYQTDGNPATSGPGFGVAVHPDALGLPLHWTKPARIFVNSMSDLFHDQVPDEYIARVFSVMALTPQHTYQILTKRHGRMRSLLSSANFWHLVAGQGREHHIGDQAGWLQVGAMLGGEPLPNVHLGVSAEDQPRADIRIPALLDTPAAVRWVSLEPLLGPVDLAGYLPRPADTPRYPVECRHGHDRCPICDRTVTPAQGLSWAVIGGESGPGARPMHPDWARSLRDQCVAAGVPFLFKQWGAWVPESAWLHRDAAPAAFLDAAGIFRPFVDGKPVEPPMTRGDAITIRLVDKKTAGRVLDGRTWDQHPQVTHA